LNDASKRLENRKGTTPTQYAQQQSTAKKRGNKTMVKYKEISEKKYNSMNKLGYISKGYDGITRGLFLTERGTVSIPIRRKK
jgi:hypothetical protein